MGSGLQDFRKSSTGFSKFQSVLIDVPMAWQHDEDVIIGNLIAAANVSP
jgi:hypothetical protein